MKPQIDCVSSALEERLFPTSFHKLFHAACQDLQGSQPEKEHKCEKRLDKYFLQTKNKIDVRGGYFEKPIEPDYSQPLTYPLSNAVLIYGVDFMSKKETLNWFPGAKLLRINSSNLQVVFGNQKVAQD